MIGLVIVSHSAKLAEGVCDLARQVAQGKVRIAAAGGTADPENPIGTDAFQVLQAIESVYSEDGVLVLMDLGSAVLSAETALELLGGERSSRVQLCAAPLVEGAVAAASLAAAGAASRKSLSRRRTRWPARWQCKAPAPQLASWHRRFRRSTGRRGPGHPHQPSRPPRAAGGAARSPGAALSSAGDA